MILSSEIQQNLRKNKVIESNEIASISGDLYIAENQITLNRRIIDENLIKGFLNKANITESNNDRKLLKG